jgi:hypothetical protein
MALNRILMLPVVIGGIISGAAIPAMGATSIPLPTAPHPYIKSGPATLTITVSSVPGSYRPGARDRYTVLVRNRGTAEADTIPVLLALPPSAGDVHANAAGTAEFGGVVWTADIKPMHQVTLRATAINGAAAPDIAEVVTTACVLKTTTTRQVCAARLLPVVERPATRR